MHGLRRGGEAESGSETQVVGKEGRRAFDFKQEALVSGQFEVIGGPFDELEAEAPLLRQRNQRGYAGGADLLVRQARGGRARRVGQPMRPDCAREPVGTASHDSRLPFYAALPAAGAGRRVASVQAAGLELAASRRRYSWLFFCQSRLIFHA